MKNKFTRFWDTAVLGSMAGVLWLVAAGCSGSTPFINKPNPSPAPLITPTPTPTETPPPVPAQLFKDVTDTFTQEADGKVDILWVIDNSGSMDEEQQNIRENAEAFTKRLNEAGSDYRVAVITTSTRDPELRSLCKVKHFKKAQDPNYDPSTDPDAEKRLTGVTEEDGIITKDKADAFKECAVVGTSGSGHEEGLEAVRRALDKDYLCSMDDKPCNGSFLRDDAALQIIIVSDEEDQPDPKVDDIYGKLLDGTDDVVTQDMIDLLHDPDWWQSDLGDSGRIKDGKEKYFPFLWSNDQNRMTHFSFLKDLKKDKTVKVHAITLWSIDGSDECHKRTNAEEVSVRYTKMAEKTGGTTSDVCGDWSETMDSLGLEASGRKLCFDLTQKPYQGVNGIDHVTVNGNVTEDWNYNKLANAVCFIESARPEIGDVIKVFYKVEDKEDK